MSTLAVLAECLGHHSVTFSWSKVAAEFAALGATAVTNPLHLLDDRAAMEQRLGPTRSAAGHAFAFRTLEQVGNRSTS